LGYKIDNATNIRKNEDKIKKFITLRKGLFAYEPKCAVTKHKNMKH